MAIQFHAQLRDKGKMADNTRRIQIDCQELSPEDELEIIKHSGKLVKVAVAEEKQVIKEIDLPDPSSTFDEGKSFSQRQRNVLFRLWEQQYMHQYKSFNEFYAHMMEKNIEKIKEQLN